MKYKSRNIALALKLMCICLSFSLHSYADKKENMKKWEEVQKDVNFYCGRGEGVNSARAKELALADMIKHISVSISDQFRHHTKQIGVNGKIEESEEVEHVIKSYSSMRLSDVHSLELSDNKDKQYVVGCYISKDELNKIFDRRQQHVINDVKKAVKYELNGKIGSAIQHLYWAQVMLNTLPDGDKVVMSDIRTAEDLQLYDWIPEQMRKILSNIKVTIHKVEQDKDEKHLTLFVTYKGEPATDLLLEYDNGGQTKTVKIAEGHGVAKVSSDTKEKNVKFLAKYCDYLSVTDSELSTLGDILSDRIYDKEAELSVNVNKKYQDKPTYAHPTLYSIERTKGYYPDDVSTNSISVKPAYLSESEAASYIPVAEAIEAALRTRNLASLYPLCNEDGKSMVDKLLTHGKARLAGTPHIQFLRNDKGVTLRSYPVCFSFSGNGNRSITENVVFHLDNAGKISQLSFALEERAANDILCMGGAWTDGDKQMLVNFVETYKTVYALKDLEYLDALFSDDALIIVGRVLQRDDTRKDRGPQISQKVEYTTLSKQQYMQNLKACFESNEFVNLKFGSSRVVKTAYTDANGNKMPAYGIQLKQDYYSSSYRDSGYLFILVEMEDPTRPLIHVRTWQPDKDLKADDIIGIEDYM